MGYEFFIARRYFNSDPNIPFGVYLLAVSLMVVFFPITVVSFFWVVMVDALYRRLKRSRLWNVGLARLATWGFLGLLGLLAIPAPVVGLYLVDVAFGLGWFSRFPYEALPVCVLLFFLFRTIITHVIAGKRHVFASVISFLSIFGIYAGVMALIITLSIMNGFESEVRSRIIGFGAHIELRKYHKEGMEDYRQVLNVVKNLDHIVAIAPYIDEKALILSKSQRSGVAVKGVDPATAGQIMNVEVYGTFELGEVQNDGQRAYPGIVLGRYLADKLRVSLGDRVQILSPTGIAPGIARMPMLKTFRVTGFFETGIFEIDDVFAYISLEEAQRLFEMPGQVTGLEIKLDDLDLADVVAERIDNLLGYPYTTITWFEMNKNLFSWMQMEKWGAFIILSLIILIAAFNIINTLIMVVMVKTREIGILKSMGATSGSIMKIFMYDGLVGGVIGTVLGCLMGFVFCWAQQTFQFFALPPDVYIISALPILMKAKDFIMISGAAVFLSLLATVYPALKAAQLDPVEAIRYE